jgi:hypothetical protein
LRLLRGVKEIISREETEIDVVQVDSTVHNFFTGIVLEVLVKAGWPLRRNRWFNRLNRFSTRFIVC